MKHFFVLITIWCALASATLAHARDWPYNESADAKAELAQAMAAAQASHKPVLLIFGANWCEDCRALDAALKKGRTAQLLAAEFQLLKVDVGNFDRNLDVVSRFDNPIKRGIPAAVLLGPDQGVVWATRAGELANARQLSDDGVAQLLRHALELLRSRQ